MQTLHDQALVRSAVTDTETQLDLTALFPGNGEMAQRCRAIDWGATSLGPVEQWPPALRTAVRIALESPFPINLWCGPDLVLLYNDAYRPVLGAKHPRSLGRPGADVWSEIWPEILPMFETIRAGGPPTYAENARFAMERAGSSADDAWFTFSLSAIREENGAIVAFLNVVAETTQQRKAERETQEARAAAERAEHRLREVFAQAPAFLAVLRGKDHRFEFVNAAYTRLIGGREAIGRTVADALPEVRDQGFIELLDRVFASGKPFVGREIALMLVRHQGSAPEQAFVDFVYQPIIEGDGETAGIVVHGSDVTEAVFARREIERLLRESEQALAHAEESEARYRFLANAIPVQVWSASPDGALDYVSERTAAYFGRSQAEVIGDQWLSVLHPDDVQKTMERWMHSVATGEPYELEFRLLSAAHGVHRWHLARATAQRDEQGRIIRWFGTNTDIEEAKQTEAELKRLTLEATEANRAKSDFLAAMSHELRTPLNAIGGYAQLIEMGVRGPVTEAQKTDLLKIQRSKDHLDSLVSDVLNFAKAGAGRIEFRTREVDVAKTVEAVLEMVTPQAASKELRLVAPASAGGLKVLADSDKMRQILLNLLANALKFTPAQGTISVDIAQSANSARISVSDTGIGVPSDQLDRIFEPFVQAKRALHATDQGVGLGLAISRQLARAMNGDLTVTSRVGEGSTFTLKLPLTVAVELKAK